MAMTPEEMRKNVCEPQMRAIEGENDGILDIARKTHKALVESNGKPCVLARLNKLEEVIDAISGQPKTFTKFGIVFQPIESKDVGRTLVGVGVLILILEKFGVLGVFTQFISR